MKFAEHEPWNFSIDITSPKEIVEEVDDWPECCGLPMRRYMSVQDGNIFFCENCETEIPFE